MIDDAALTPEERAAWIRLLCEHGKVPPAFAEDYITKRHEMTIREIQHELTEFTARRAIDEVARSAEAWAKWMLDEERYWAEWTRNDDRRRERT